MTKIKRTHLLKVGITGTTLLVFLFSTNPNRLSVGFLFIPVALIFLLIYFTTQLFLEISPIMLSFSRKRVFSLICATIPTLGLLLKSIDQLTLKDLSLLLLLVVASSFYVSVLRFEKAQE